MKPKKYIKINGIIPETPFKKGDIVTYFCVDRVVRPNKIKGKYIMILDSIQVTNKYDILAKVMLLKLKNGECFISNIPFVASTFWYNGDYLCYSTPEETKIFLNALSNINKKQFLEDINI